LSRWTWTAPSSTVTVRCRFEGVGGGTETRPISTLNGTLCAMTRTIVAILETHQQADGSVRVPKALQKWMSKEVLTPVTGG
jgi:seryl-tRNA synthetase